VLGFTVQLRLGWAFGGSNVNRPQRGSQRPFNFFLTRQRPFIWARIDVQMGRTLFLVVTTARRVRIPRQGITTTTPAATYLLDTPLSFSDWTHQVVTALDLIIHVPRFCKPSFFFFFLPKMVTWVLAFWPWPCLVRPENQKLFKIPRHIKS
jgi:hypothetical protein